MAKGWTRTGGRRTGGLVDLAVGQRLLQFGDACVGDLAAVEVKRLQPVQPFEMDQPRVGDLGVVEGKVLVLSREKEVQVGHPFDVARPVNCLGAYATLGQRRCVHADRERRTQVQLLQ